jgi:hypothetical protein
MGQVRRLNTVTAPAPAQENAAARETLDKGWDNAKGGGGQDGGAGGKGSAQPKTWPGAGGDGASAAGPDGGPLTGADTSDLPVVATPPAKNAAPWQGLLELAQKLMAYASKLISISSLLVFAGKKLATTAWGASFGLAMIQAGTYMAYLAGAMAAAASAIGAVILTKYDQKLQGAVITVSALALSISAFKAAQGDQMAYDSASQRIAAAQTMASDQAAQFLGSGPSTSAMEYLGAARTAANLAWGKSKEMSYINGAFGLADGISGLVQGGGAVDMLKAGVGLAQTAAGFIPMKGATGQIVNTALTGIGIALDMVPQDSHKSDPAPAGADGGASSGNGAPPTTTGPPAATGGDANPAEATQEPPVLPSRPLDLPAAALAPASAPSGDAKPAETPEEVPVLPSRPLNLPAAALAPAIDPSGDAKPAETPEELPVLPSRPLDLSAATPAPASAPSGDVKAAETTEELPALPSRPLDLSAAMPAPAIAPSGDAQPAETTEEVPVLPSRPLDLPAAALAPALAPGGDGPLDKVLPSGSPDAAGGKPTPASAGPKGSLSAQYESGDDGPASIAYDKTGGNSYGTYQFASKTGTMDEFLKYAQANAPDLAQPLIDAGGASAALKGDDTFRDAWTTAADDPAFAQLQTDFVKSKFYTPLATRVQGATDLDVTARSTALQEVVWSVGVQNGPYSNVVQNALSGQDASKMTDSQIINAIYDERTSTVVNADGKTVLKYFSRSSPAVQASVLKRLNSERAAALAALGNH